MSRNTRLTILIFLSFLLLILNGCSYSPKITKVSKSNLATYNPKHLTETIQEKRITNENDLIIQGIWYEMHGYYKKSNYFYNILYEKTGGIEYLFRELTTALYGGIVSKNIPKLEELVAQNPSNIQLKRLLISLYINQNSNEKAKKIGAEIVLQSGKAIDYELSASPYILSGDYTKAVDLLTVAYNKTYNEDILTKITVLLANYIGDVVEARNRLEKHRAIHQCSEKICGQLLEIYSKEQNVTALIGLYRDLYRKTAKEIYGVKLVEAYIYLREFNEAIDFLQQEYSNDELLYEVFLAKKDYDNALIIAEKLYFKEQTPRWLAESAMALYEKSRDKYDKDMLNRVVNKFEKALSEGVKDSVYLNYYGYTLIDKDIDVRKGIEIVKDALKAQPNNSYYLDSLAWGYYKLHNCKEAYKEMKKVVDMEGLDEEDIAQHWNAIKECNQVK